MRKAVIFSFFALLIGLAGCTANAGNTAHEFWVRGNCDMCKATIEEALQDIDGVAEASYDLDFHAATVSYDSAKVQVEDLYQAVANAGYDTRQVKAVATAYQALPTCCKKPEDM